MANSAPRRQVADVFQEAAALGLELDPERAERLKAERTRRVNQVYVPLLRGLGFLLLAIAVFVHHVFVFGTPWSAHLTLPAAFIAYSLAAWALLYATAGRAGWLSAGELLLVTDILLWVLAIYATGGERSWLFIILLLRTVDQSWGGLRRSLFFAHLCTLAYLGLLTYLHLIEGRELVWPVEMAKAATLYLASLYVAASGQAPERLRERTRAAMRMARDLLRRLGEQSHEVEESKARVEAALDVQAALARENARLYQRAQLQQRRLVQIFDATSDGILYVSLAGRLESANRRAGELLGFDSAGAVGRAAADLVSPPTCGPEPGWRGLRAALSRPPEHAAGEAVTPEGHVLRWVAQPTRDPAGQVVGLTVSFHDFTPTADLIRRLQEQSRQLEESRRRAEQASEAKSQFLANMSHEIRTPLNSIVGAAQLALDSELTPEQRAYLEIVRASAASLIAVIDNVLDFSKAEAHELTLARAPFSLRDTLGEVVQMFAPAAHAKALELACDVSPGVPDALVGDAVRLRQVMINLLSNAVKFTQRGEIVLQVDVDVDAAPAGAPADLHFAVRDTGIGVPAAQQRLIFEAFAQVDGSTTRRYGGAGLGLAISQRLVELMGGRISVRSETGRGSTFHVIAPFGRDPAATDRVPAALPEMDSARALVADGHAASRRVAAGLLRGWGAAVDETEDGPATLRALDDARRGGSPYDLAVVDLRLDGIDGLSLAERHARGPALARGLILMLRAAGTGSDAARCRDLGVGGYLVKPVREANLRDAIVAARSEPGTEARPAGTPPRAAVRRRILLVEDHLVNQEVTARLLRREGHEVVTASNGRAAVELFAPGRFDLVLMDLHMPEMDGLEATAAIRGRESGHGDPPVRIVAMTAVSRPESATQCLQAGMNDTITKPIEREELLGVVANPAPPALPSSPVRPASDGPAAVLDGDDLLARLGGDRALARRLADLLVSTTPGQVQAIREALRARDPKRLFDAAHGLKGSLGNLSAHAAYEAAARLERIGRSGTVAGGEEALGALETELARLGSALDALAFGEESAPPVTPA